MTALPASAALARPVGRRIVAAVSYAALGLADIAVFGGFARHGDAVFAFSQPFVKVTVPDLSLPAAATAYVLGALTIALGVLRVTLDLSKAARRAAVAAALVFFLISLVCWAYGGRGQGSFNVVNLLQGTLADSIPLIMGALAGAVSERSGVINIAIEGQLLLGAFAAALVASAVGALWLGLISGALAGALIGVLLAVFAISYLVDQIVLGVVLNVFVSGLTGFLYDRLLVPDANTLNSPATYQPVKIPVLGDIPVIGPVFFDSTIFLYLTYLAIAAVQAGLFHTRWGLRTRAVGEHPAAADAVGIRVAATRYRNVILGGALAGIGGAYLTIGSVGSFGKDMSSGMGYIALAAMIFGRWTPLGGVGAALLFGFTFELQSILGAISVPIPSEMLLMSPYLATIVAVAGLVGRVRPPAADGKPYVKA